MMPQISQKRMDRAINYLVASPRLKRTVYSVGKRVGWVFPYTPGLTIELKQLQNIAQIRGTVNIDIKDDGFYDQGEKLVSSPFLAGSLRRRGINKFALAAETGKLDDKFSSLIYPSSGRFNGTLIFLGTLASSVFLDQRLKHDLAELAGSRYSNVVYHELPERLGDPSNFIAIFITLALLPRLIPPSKDLRFFRGMELAGLGLCLGGSLSNSYDSYMCGRVIDFIVSVFNISNPADHFIDIGLMLLTFPKVADQISHDINANMSRHSLLLSPYYWACMMAFLFEAQRLVQPEWLHFLINK